jgi:hypothetical protein
MNDLEGPVEANTSSDLDDLLETLQERVGAGG